jgi:hypothetical protein
MTAFVPSPQSERSEGSLGWVQALNKTVAEVTNTTNIAKALSEARKYATQGRTFDSAQDLISTFAKERWGQVLIYPPVTTVDAIGKGETALFLLSMLKGVPEAVRAGIIADARALDAKLASYTFIESKDPAKVAEYSQNRAKAALDWGARAIEAGAPKAEVYALLKWLKYLLSDSINTSRVEQRQTDIQQQTPIQQQTSSFNPTLILSDVEKELEKQKKKRRKKQKERKKQRQVLILASAAAVVAVGTLTAWAVRKSKKESPNVP